MIAFLILIYASFYFLVFGKGLVKTNARNISIFVGVGVVLVGIIIFMWLTYAPTTKDGRTFQYVVQIVPNVAGPVTEVTADALVPLKKGDILFKIDQTQYQAAVDQIESSIKRTEAQKLLAEIQVERSEGLVKRSAGSQQELDNWVAKRDEAVAGIASLEAQLNDARWKLEQTIVRAPSDGFVINRQIRPGTRVTTLPGMAPMTFVSSEGTQIVCSMSQSASRYVQPEDTVEIVFAGRPGQVFAGKVVAIAKATGEAQLAPSGLIPSFTGQPIQGRRGIRIFLDDETIIKEMGQGAQSFVAIYTQKGKPFHVITKVVVRMQAWLGFLTNPAG
ncbi:MAG: efflux RND transporter periplasmic adaptor subunit [Arenicellales bacterium]